jgi:CHAT domain-containing protein/Tfp pilus assembly protein PilF
MKIVVALCERYYPETDYPKGHTGLAGMLNDMGYLLQVQGDFKGALGYFRRALAMKQRLYPAKHSSLSLSLNNLAFVLRELRDYAGALDYYQQALAMNQVLYPEKVFPNGHRDLASSLRSVGRLFQDQGDSVQAVSYFNRALAMFEKLYPESQFPRGHDDLFYTLHELGRLFQDLDDNTGAVDCFLRALAMGERLYPVKEFPRGHPDLVATLHRLGFLLGERGDYARALGYCKRELDMCQRLYPENEYPKGQPDLAMSLHNLGSLFMQQGDYTGAFDYFQRALTMRQRLYPTKDLPDGHRDLAMTLGNLGALLELQGDLAGAMVYFKQSLAMYRRLFEKSNLSGEHLHLVISLNNMGFLLQAHGDYAGALPHYQHAVKMSQRIYLEKASPTAIRGMAMPLHNLGTLLTQMGDYKGALTYLQRALAMYQQLYPKKGFPNGHPHLAMTLFSLGSLRYHEGDYAGALSYFQQAQSMRQHLYPEKDYLRGHPRLALGLYNLGYVMMDQGDYAGAFECVKQALAMQHDLTEYIATSASEAQALAFQAYLPQYCNLLLSTSRHASQLEADSYAAIWRSKAELTRILASRLSNFRVAAHLVGPGIDRTMKAKLQQLGDDLQTTATQVSYLVLAPGPLSPNQRGRLRQLTEQKEELERQLAKLLPGFAGRQALDRLGHSALLERLPGGTVFVHLLRYTYFEQDPELRGVNGARFIDSYVAYVLAAGQPVRRIELQEAEPVDLAIAAWSRDIRSGKVESTAAARLRKLVWEPIAKHFPRKTKTVFLAPDATLCTVPWAALPGNAKGTFLLEDYALALVPHGPYLLEQLSTPSEPPRDGGLFLAVGGVAYSRKPAPLVVPAEEQVRQRSPVPGDKDSVWSDLPASKKEVDHLVSLAGQRTVLIRSEQQASVPQLMVDLPWARWAHLATHGFFAAEEVRSSLGLDESLFRMQSLEQGPPPGARNLMTLSGLVLAGANLPPTSGDGPLAGARGILTADGVQRLPLQGLELAVLSACETGLGSVAGGEGVFGLQRAFHLAGAKNVIASLWRVDDNATRALMERFYEYLWRKNLPPLEALRSAQLDMMRSYSRINGRLPDRGPGKPGIGGPSDNTDLPAARGQNRPPLYWAGFVLSGTGR